MSREAFPLTSWIYDKGLVPHEVDTGQEEGPWIRTGCC